ncbi:MAG TPA: LuxR C-terminal-related transcriptional regulator [Nitrospiraceae bacterium]|nr:LuxR C-terminal-related transcriptional regulator [Nitrospiraceae bacterium]
MNASSNKPTRAFTPHEERVLAGICQGKTNREIALELGRSEKTVKTHVTAIFRVLGVVNRTQAALLMARKQA